MTKLYFEKYNDTSFAPEDILSFDDVLQLYETIYDTELIELIKRHNIRLFDVIKSVNDTESGSKLVYCEEIFFNALEEEHMVKRYKMLREEVKVLSGLYPQLKMNNFSLYDSSKANSEINNLKETVKQQENLLILKNKEIEEYQKKLKTIHPQDGIAKKTAEMWFGYVESAVKLAFHCFENKKKYTADELKGLFSQLGITLNTKAMEAFRQGLPEEYRCKRGESRSADTPPNPKN